MKPFKSAAIIASWLFRILLVWFVYQNYLKSFTTFEVQRFDFYISAAYVLFGALSFIGGFLQKAALTVFSGLVVFILPIIQLIRSFPEELLSVLLTYLIPLAVGFYLFTHGNDA